MLTKTAWKDFINTIKEDKQSNGNENIIYNFLGIFSLLAISPIFLTIDILFLPLEIIYYFIK